jgi:hypothetical protein
MLPWPSAPTFNADASMTALGGKRPAANGTHPTPL